MEFAQREVSTVSLPLERRLALALEAELDLFDPRRYAGSTFITEGGSEYHVYQDGGKCLLVGMNGEFGPEFSTQNANIIYLAGISQNHPGVANILKEAQPEGVISYRPDFWDLEQRCREHREAVQKGLPLMLYCELNGQTYLMFTPPVTEKDPDW